MVYDSYRKGYLTFTNLAHKNFNERRFKANAITSNYPKKRKDKLRFNT